MGWELGWDGSRFVGYGVVAYCDYPGCFVTIDRGLSYKCEDFSYSENLDEDPEGCGGFFCESHRTYNKCEDCSYGFLVAGVQTTPKNIPIGCIIY